MVSPQGKTLSLSLSKEQFYGSMSSPVQPGAEFPNFSWALFFQQSNVRHQEIRQHYNSIWKIPRKKLLSYWYYFWKEQLSEKKSLLWYVLKTSSEPTIIWETWGHWQKQKLTYSSTLMTPSSSIKMTSVFVHIFQFIVFLCPHP